MQVNLLRKIVDNGWTITNRRNITNVIGKEEFKEISLLAKKAQLGGDVFEYKTFADSINEGKYIDIKNSLKEIINKINSAILPSRSAMIQSHFDEGGTIAYAYPKDYTKLIGRDFIEARPERVVKWGRKERVLKAQPAHYVDVYALLPHYHIDKLWTTGKGSGSSAVKNVVLTSLKDKRTQGRVTLDASCIDGETCPSGFYYKLGFRMKSPENNQEFAKWLEQGGKREDAPFITGDMYLPKENILQCLKY